MELNSTLEEITAASVGVAVITPDSETILDRFSTAFAIGYPLLSDIGGVVVQQFGVLNHNIVPNERQAAGMPFPGHFLLGPDGRIRSKSFTGDLRHRASGTVMVAEAFDRYGGPSVDIRTDEVHATVTLSTNRLFGGQETAVRISLDVADGWHVYGTDVAAPYRPLEVVFDVGGRLVDQQSIRWPDAALMDFASLGESLPAHGGHIVGAGRIRLRWSPPPSVFGGLEEAVRSRAIEPGVYEIKCELRYQACRDDVCLAPQAVPFMIIIHAEPTAPAP